MSIQIEPVGKRDASFLEGGGELGALMRSHDWAIVALTGWGQDEDRRQALIAGFDRHLIEPADIGALQVLLGSLGTADARTATTAS